jgi:subtilisin family serine protease
VRRFLLVVVVTLVFAGAATAAATTDPLEPQEWWLNDIGATQTAAPGPGVPITVVDSGVDPTHPEFAGRPDTTFINGQTVSGREEYHGTIVASLAAAPANGQGIVGVYPQAALDAYDASPDARGITFNTAIAGVLAAAAHCPGVINLSFGGALQDPQLHDAILTAYRNGCFVVAAAGNDGESGSQASYPAAWPHVFTVGATDQNDQIASFSTVGPDIDVVAPGAAMIAAVPLSRDPSGYASNLAGTSFSAPVVAAAAAWVWTVRPTLTVTQLGEVLRHSARDLGTPGYDTTYGWGLLNIQAALTAPAPAPDPAEPNDDVDEVKPGKLFQVGEAPLTTPAKASIRLAATLDGGEDPRDVYRIWVPARQTVRVSVAAGGDAAARIWGSQTVSTAEGIADRRRDLRGPSIRAGKAGFFAYAEVLLTGRSTSARYTLSVKASKR